MILKIGDSVPLNHDNRENDLKQFRMHVGCTTLRFHNILVEQKKNNAVVSRGMACKGVD